MCDLLSCQQTLGCKANRSQRVTANTLLLIVTRYSIRAKQYYTILDIIIIIKVYDFKIKGGGGIVHSRKFQLANKSETLISRK